MKEEERISLEQVDKEKIFNYEEKYKVTLDEAVENINYLADDIQTLDKYREKMEKTEHTYQS